MQNHLLARFWRRAALMAVMAVGVISLQSGQLSAQQPPPNNPATGTPTIIGALRVGEVARVDTSSIADADGLTDTEFSYTWFADDDLLEEGAFFRAATSINEYALAPYDAGLTIKVQVHFDDDQGNSESLDVQATSTVAAVAPDAPPDLSGSLGDPGELDLSWPTPAVCDFTVVFDCWLDLDRTFSVGDGGSEITGYTVQWKLASGSWGVASHVSEAEVTTTSHTVAGLSASSTYTVRVLARNAVGAGTPSTEVTVSGTNLNVGPVVSGKAAPSFFETNPRDVETYIATDPESDTITWSLSGPDASFFSIADGVLNFDSAGDYEDPRDAGRNNVYEVTIHASDGSNSAVFHVTVVIQDVDETPLVAGPTTINVRGSTTAYVGRYGATDPEGFVTSWEPLSGVDAQHFEFSDAGDLSFTAVPDFDNPADTNGDNTYQVTVSASSDGDRGTRTGTLDAGVTVTDPNQVIRPPIIFGGGGGGGGSRGPTPSEADFEWTVEHDIEELDGGNDKATGLWSDGTTLWIADNSDGAGDAVYAYDPKTGERIEEREFELDERNRAPRGVWSDRTVIWISDSGQEKLFAHDLESGERLPERDLALAERNRDVRGIWSADGTMWALDGGKDSIFAYDLESGDLLGEYALDSSSGDPHGIWSDGVGVWVSDHVAKRLLAYRLPALPDGEEPDEHSALERVSDEDFKKLSGASNNSPRGLWSDGGVMYVADQSDDKVYTYNMPDAIDARLATLELSGVDIGEFDSAQTEYAGTAGDDVTETTVGAEASQSGAAILIEPDDDDDPENAHQVALEDVSEITVTVTSRDESRERVYRVLVGDPGQEVPDGPAPPCFRGAVATGFSLVVYAGGSVEELVDCAQSRHGTALYTLHDGSYVPYILGAPEFVNSSFGELFAGAPATTPLIIKSDGPPTADLVESITGDDPTPPWPECLRGEIATGFSLVLYQGGAIEELVACAESRNITALYTLHDGGYAPYILGAPEFVNRSFRALFTDGLPAITPLIVKSDGVSAAAATAGAP